MNRAVGTLKTADRLGDIASEASQGFNYSSIRLFNQITNKQTSCVPLSERSNRCSQSGRSCLRSFAKYMCRGEYDEFRVCNRRIAIAGLVIISTSHLCFCAFQNHPPICVGRRRGAGACILFGGKCDIMPRLRQLVGHLFQFRLRGR